MTHVNSLVCLLSLAIIPGERVTIEHVDRVEINHVYNPHGHLVLDQVIWWNWSLSEDCWRVVDWRMLKNVRRHDDQQAARWNADHPDGPPYVARWIGGHATPHRVPGGFASQWWDETSGKRRQVKATTRLETWTAHDRELIERETLPEANRQRLK